MRDDVRRAALAAALKTIRSVASPPRVLRRAGAALGLGGALLGCSDLHGGDPRAMSDAAVPDAPLAEVASDAAAPDALASPCDELLAGLRILDDGTGFGAQFADVEARLDPAVGGCCHALDAAVRAGERPVEPFSPLALACCDVVVFAQGLEPFSELGCTPWGPPCPPSMPTA
jgi:hypothetical protein